MAGRWTQDSATWPAKPIVCVTGGNSGVGFGFCKRLLDQLSSPPVSDLRDAFPLPQGTTAPDSVFATPRGLTLILACRNAMKAHKACTALLEYVGKKRPKSGFRKALWKEARRRRVLSNQVEDSEVATMLTSKKYLSNAQYRQLWLSNLRIEFVPLDLSSYSSVVHCSKELKARYPYVSHLVLNAGAAPFRGIDWIDLTKSILRNPILAITFPSFCIEEAGIVTDDGLGWTWQCNVFGHYVLAHEMLSHIAKSPQEEPRIIFTGSIDGLPEYFDASDRHALKRGSYQSTKFQSGLMAWGFNEVIAARQGDEQRIRSFLVHPGVVAGNLYREVLGWLLDRAMYCIFILGRLLGSTNHVVDAYAAGIAFVYVALAPLSLLYAHVALAQPSSGEKRQWQPTRFGARATAMGRPYVGVDVVLPPKETGGQSTFWPVEQRRWWDASEAVIRQKRWWWNKEMSADLIEHCDSLRIKLAEKHRV